MPTMGNPGPALAGDLAAGGSGAAGFRCARVGAALLADADSDQRSSASFGNRQSLPTLKHGISPRRASLRTVSTRALSNVAAACTSKASGFRLRVIVGSSPTSASLADPDDLSRLVAVDGVERRSAEKQRPFADLARALPEPSPTQHPKPIEGPSR